MCLCVQREIKDSVRGWDNSPNVSWHMGTRTHSFGLSDNNNVGQADQPDVYVDVLVYLCMSVCVRMQEQVRRLNVRPSMRT